MKKYILYLFIICLSPFFSNATPDTDSIFYNINATIKGFKGKKAYIGIYNFDKMYVADSTLIDTASGSFQFKSNKKTREGLYFISIDTTWILDIILTKSNQKIDFITDTRDIFGNLVYKNSKENQAYVNITNQIKDRRTKLESMAQFAQMLMKATKNDKDMKKEYQIRVKEVYKEMDSITDSNIIKFKGTFLESLLKASRNIKVPESIQERVDGNFNMKYFHYILNHYWDEFNFKDERLLTTKLLKSKIETYFDKMVPQNADSVYLYIDKLMLKATSNKLVYNETLRILTQKYDNINLMGGDAILIYLVDKYHHNPLSTTIKEQLEALDYRANLYKPNTIGKIAPDFTLKTEKDSSYNLHKSINKYTVLFFYSSLCNHCIAALPAISEAHLKYKDKGFSFVAINTDPEVSLFQKFVTDNPKYDWINLYEKGDNSKLVESYAAYFLPAIYILDENKTIIAKRMKPENLDNILNSLDQ